MAGYAGLPCAAMVSWLSDEQGKYILGDTFIRNYYATFDYKKYTVTLATKAGDPYSI